MADFRIKCPFCGNNKYILKCQCNSTDFRDESGDSRDEASLTCNKCEIHKSIYSYTCPNCEKQFNAAKKKFISEDRESSGNSELVGCGAGLILLVFLIACVVHSCKESQKAWRVKSDFRPASDFLTVSSRATVRGGLPSLQEIAGQTTGAVHKIYAHHEAERLRAAITTIPSTAIPQSLEIRVRKSKSYRRRRGQTLPRTQSQPRT